MVEGIKQERGMKEAALSDDNSSPQVDSSKSFTLLPQRLTTVLLFITSFFLACHVGICQLNLVVKIIHYFHFPFDEQVSWALYEQFHLGKETNLPTYFSTFILGLAAFLLYVLHRASRKQTNHWLYLSLVFLFLSVDESAQLHEIFGGMAGQKVNNYFEKVPPFMEWGWMAPYAILTTGIGLYFMRFTWQLPSRIRRLFFLSGGLYVFAALILESLESHFETVYGADNKVNDFLYPLEETLEMGAIILFIHALMLHLRTTHHSIIVVSKE